MYIRYVILLLSTSLLLTSSHSLLAQEESSKRLGVRKQYVKRSQAIALSALFPGLGQLATGHRYRGTALVASEIACMVIWLTAHEDYNTQSTQFNLESQRYRSAREGGSFDEADEIWKRLKNKKDDLDGSHLRRRIFGVLAAAVYSYNLVDVLLYNGAEPTSKNRLSVEPLLLPKSAGVVLVAQF